MIRSAAASFLAAALVAAPAASPAGDDGLALQIVTGSPAGVYHPLGTAMATAWSRGVDGLDVEAETSGGSLTNLRLIETGEAQLALVQNDIAHYAVAGAEMFASEGPLAANLGLAMLYPEPVQIVTLAGAGIDSVADLAGRRLSVGARGSGTELNARQILAAYGLDYSTVHASMMPFEDAVVALRNGYIEAAFITAGVPTGAVVNLSRLYGHPVDLVPIQGEEVASLTEGFPFYTPITIPAGTYAGIDHDVATVTVQAMLVAGADVPDDKVASMLGVLFEPATLRRLCATHRRGCDIDRHSASIGMPIEMHPGAAAFYERNPTLASDK